MEESAISTRYNASEVEPRWYKKWEEAGLFAPDSDKAKPVYTITIPPPNITGSLHMGHALCYPLQDVFGRYQRLRGKNVLVIPGQDHAGIATQSVVAKQLKAQGLNPVQIGRDAFIEKVWEWRKESGDTILNQLRSLGCAFDWNRSRFTLDPAYERAVLQVFIDWFERGLIYRGKRVLNWDPVLRTSVSDIETERKTVRGSLYRIRYPFEDGSGHITIATTRPETLLADVAVAVHPSDQRYVDAVGKNVVLPLVGRSIPVIADVYPDPTFGTGAVKITPAHDPNDYEVGVRHGLPMPVLLDESCKITSLGGAYAGLDRFEARKRIVQDLEEGGLLESVEEHEIPLLISERSGEAIEPLLSESWFAKQGDLSSQVIDAVKSGRVKFAPVRFERVFLEWMENIRDWNISRRLWWGHRIPVYTTEAGRQIAALSWEDAQVKAGGDRILSQDEEVLDTWFSSGLWPFATLGWPDQTPDLLERYPTNLLITDRNIINLWVARMLMMGMDQMGVAPFQDVFIYATVLTEDGRRMSKSLGTGVDPMGIIETVGADALRFMLLSQTGSNQDIRYSERRVDEARNFCNKIWNAARFLLINLDSEPSVPTNLDPIDRWVLSRLHSLERTVREAYDGFDVQAAAQALQGFFWSEVCDWYIEISKSRLSHPTQKAVPQWVLLEVFRAFLIMLHPLMPHISEEVYSHLPLPKKEDFLMAERWPEIPAHHSARDIEDQVERWFQLVRAVRALRADLEIGPLKSIPEVYVEGDLNGGENILKTQAWVETIIPGRPENGRFVSSVSTTTVAHIVVDGLVDLEERVSKLDREIEKSNAECKRLEAQLSNPQFVERAKPEVVQQARDQVTDLRIRMEGLSRQRDLLRQD